MQDIAGTYLRQRDQLPSSKPAARYGLECIAYEASRLHAGTAEQALIGARLSWLLGGLNDIAASALWGGLDRHPDYPGGNFNAYLRGPKVDWTVVGQAAETGLTLLTGGDYADTTAAIAVQDLVLLYQTNTGRRPTFSTTGKGVMSARGLQRQVGNSPCFRFLEAFFQEVDPTVSALWLTSELKHVLTALRKRAAHDQA